MTSRFIRVLVADDHPIVASGVSHELKRDPAIDLMGCASNSTELVARLEAQHCHVVIADYVMPGGRYGDGLSLIALLRRRFPQTGLAVLTVVDNATLLRSLLAYEGLCLLSKLDAASHILHAVRTLHEGGVYHSPSIRKMIASLDLPGNAVSLTRREAEVIRLFCSGATITEISRMSHRSVQTVSSQKRSAMRKLGLSRDADLIRHGFEAMRIHAAEGARAPDAG